MSDRVRVYGSVARVVSDKARSLLYLQSLGLNVPRTLVVGSLAASGIPDVAKLIDGQGPYYARLAFHDLKANRRVGRIVTRGTAERDIREMVAQVAATPADLLVQPLLRGPLCGGTLTKSGHVLVEIASGAPPTLFHLGRLQARAVTCDGTTTTFERIRQDRAIVWTDNGFHETSRFAALDPEPIVQTVAAAVRGLSNTVTEWMVDDSGDLTFFDHKELGAAQFVALGKRPPEIPFAVSMSSSVLRKAPLRVFRLSYPDLRHLDSARQADLVIVEEGALLSHLSVYSGRESYDCVFGAMAITPRSSP